jgi:hypothetical protein
MDYGVLRAYEIPRGPVQDDTNDGPAIDPALLSAQQIEKRLGKKLSDADLERYWRLYDRAIALIQN